MKILKQMFPFVIGLFFIGCEDVIEVDLDTATPRLHIEASIDWEKNTSGNLQKIKLSTSTGYYSEEFPTVSGANITVTRSDLTEFNFIEIPSTGEYICSNFDPVMGATYTLTITLNGETYTATETLISVPNLEDTIDQNNAGGMSGDEIEITYYYQDNGAEENYYLNSIVTNRVAFPAYQVEDDENNQGNLTPVYYAHEDLESGDTINIKLYGISQSYFNFFKKLLLASGNEGSPFPTIPAAVRGNIVNETNSENFALGYFRVSETVSREYILQ